MVINCRRLTKVYTTCVSSSIKSLHTSHRQHGRSSADSKMSSISKSWWFRPQIWSIRSQVCHFSGVISGKKYWKYIFYLSIYCMEDWNLMIVETQSFGLLNFFPLLLVFQHRFFFNAKSAGFLRCGNLRKCRITVCWKVWYSTAGFSENNDWT